MVAYVPPVIISMYRVVALVILLVIVLVSVKAVCLILEVEVVLVVREECWVLVTAMVLGKDTESSNKISSNIIIYQ